MSSTSASHQEGQKRKLRRRGNVYNTESPDYRPGGTRGEVYLHHVTDQQAALLTSTENESLLQEITKRTGAEVAYLSPLQDTKTVIIRGARPQIKKAVTLINERIRNGETISDNAEKFWLQWVQEAFPDLDSCAYFMPPVYVNRVAMTRQLISGQDVMVVCTPPGQAGRSSQSAMMLHYSAQASSPQPSFIQDSDVRDDAAMQRVLFCLQKMAEQNREVLVGMSQLRFGQYLGEPCYAAAAAQLPLPASLSSSLPQNWKQGDFDVLLIHQVYGLVVCEVKSYGDNVKKLNMSQQDIDKNIRKKLRDAASYLNKAEAMLSHLVSDIDPKLHITKTIAVPNLTACQVQHAIAGDLELAKELLQCLKIKDAIDITGFCLCSDQLSDPKTPWDVTSDVLKELGNWWQRCVVGCGSDSHMTCEVYRKIVARFCGPATTVTVPCTSPPRLCVKTLGQAVSFTGECYTALITLFPEQVDLLNTAPPRLFVAGPPGTGKSVVLMLMGIEWLRCGKDVRIVSTSSWSLGACSMLYHLMLQFVNAQQTAGVAPGQLHLLHYDFDKGKEVEKAVNDLSQTAMGGSSYIIADEVLKDVFQSFCDKLLTRVPHLCLWAASCYHGHAPAGWPVEYLTRPLRSPPAVVREVEQDKDISEKCVVRPYSARVVPSQTDGPPVKRLYHRGQDHSGDILNCVICGQEVARFLLSLRIGTSGQARNTAATVTTGGLSTPPCLQWKDVLVLCWDDVDDSLGLVIGLREYHIPVQVMKDDDIEDVATARTDVVWAASARSVCGLERKVIVCVEDDIVSSRLYTMSRCVSQLVVVLHCRDVQGGLKVFRHVTQRSIRVSRGLIPPGLLMLVRCVNLGACQRTPLLKVSVSTLLLKMAKNLSL